MPGPPGELMTRENLISREWQQKSPTYGHVTKLFLESEFQHKGNKQMKKLVSVFMLEQEPTFSSGPQSLLHHIFSLIVNSKQNLAVFSAATDSELKISSNTTQKRTKQNLVSVFMLEQETTFSSGPQPLLHHIFSLVRQEFTLSKPSQNCFGREKPIV